MSKPLADGVELSAAEQKAFAEAVSEALYAAKVGRERERDGGLGEDTLLKLSNGGVLKKSSAV